MNIDAKILNETKQTKFNRTIKGSCGIYPWMQKQFNIHKSINMTHYINGMKTKNHMIISIGTEIAFDKIQHHFMIKTLNK